ncbi:hypothetical protein BGX29_003356 [Mortierella sp. GBA35]|nr:hypothetical protein BGX23_005237 [Mortierella sp. AD031]KAF9103441.1 hypothetical protein BGX29_003356 [Mortierella sp. GBA35]KAG0213755.1 hypothetical protein BGX33_002676 [Mortierella sp. NVP41]
MYNPLKKQHIKTTVVLAAFLTAFGYLQLYVYTANEASFESRRPLTVPITIVSAASGNHACALEAFLYDIHKTLNQLQTDPREDQRRERERARLGAEYLETSPDLDEIRIKNKNKKPGLGNNMPHGARKVDENGEEEEVIVVENGAEGDREVVEEKRRIAEFSSGSKHRRRGEGGIDDDQGEKEEGKVENEGGEANTPLYVGGGQSIEDLDHHRHQQQPQQQQSTTDEAAIGEIEFEIRPTVLIYNMGMGPGKRKKRRFKALIEAGYIDEPLDFDFSKYPDWWRLGTETRGEYGWKSGIIEEVSQRVLASSNPPSASAAQQQLLHQQHTGSIPLSNNTTRPTEAGRAHNPGIVLWLDSGDRISAAFLRWLPSFLLQNGLWSPQSQDDMQTWTHPGLLAYYHDSIENYPPGESNCNGAAMAFDVRNHTMRDGIMREWVQCSRTKECIAPEGSSRANHRQDQAALTYLVKRMGYGQELCHGMPDVYGIQVNQDRYCKEDIAAHPDRVA